MISSPSAQLRLTWIQTGLTVAEFSREVVFEMALAGHSISATTVKAWLRPTSSKAHRGAPRLAARVATARWPKS